MRIFFLCFFIAWTSNAFADPTETLLSVNSTILKDSIGTSLPSNARWSFTASDLTPKANLITTGNAQDSPLTPGSIMKLIVTAAALDSDMKDKIELDTVISYTGEISQGALKGDLYIRGSGNAMLSAADLQKAGDRLIVLGIREITGNLIVDDTLFEPHAAKSAYAGPAYAPSGALGLDMHTISVAVSGTNISVEPSNRYVKVNVVSSRKPDIHRLDDLTYEVTGASSTTIKKRFALSNPALYAGGVLRTQIEERGIRIHGTVTKGKQPVKVVEVLNIKAPDISEIVKYTNNNSLNVFADNMLLFIGARRFGAPGTFEKGLKAMELFLDELGIDRSDMRIADGSGLSPLNRITSKQVTDILRKIAQAPWFDSFYASLPRAGMDGTLGDIGYRNEHVRAKTGRLDNAYCIAGYLERKGSLKAFAYMVNVPGADLITPDATGQFLRTLAGEGI